MLEHTQSSRSKIVIPASLTPASGPKESEHSTPTPPQSAKISRQALPRVSFVRSIRKDTPTSTREIEEVIAATMTDRKKTMEAIPLSTGSSAPILANT